ncbi:MAG: TorF family putative porin [Sphingobium sp.]|nr:TorF family putative porin [Sphingobium sp.]
MRKSIIGLSAVAFVAMAAPAFAQDEPTDGFTISGSVALTSDYRFRGVTQNQENFAIQGGLTVSHESGFYVGTWGSNIDFGGTGEGSAEVDLIAGYAFEVTPGWKLDGGVTYYWYPGNDKGTKFDIVEPYLSISGTLGPIGTKLGVAYAPDQGSLGDNSSVYVYNDNSFAVPSTPFTLKTHIGYTKSDSFLGGPDGDALDWLGGIDTTWKNLTLGVAYVNTDWKGVKNAAGADGTVVFSLTAAF